MKRCPTCNSLMREDDNFCPKDGTDLRQVDSERCSCGTPHYDFENFCPNCGECKTSDTEVVKSIWSQLRKQIDRVVNI